MNKIKKAIISSVGVATITLGSISASKTLDTNKFYKQADRGELYVTDFNKEEYYKLRTELSNKVDNYLNKKELMSYNEFKLYLQTVSREIDKTWILENNNKGNVVFKINNKLKDKINKYEK